MVDCRRRGSAAWLNGKQRRGEFYRRGAERRRRGGRRKNFNAKAQRGKEAKEKMDQENAGHFSVSLSSLCASALCVKSVL
jgi:hypothetical protein